MEFFISLMLADRRTVFKLSQPKNVLIPIFVTEFGIVTVVNDDNKVHSYSSQCFRTMKDDFSKMFGIFDDTENEPEE